jgi:hypothetical protein
VSPTGGLTSGRKCRAVTRSSHQGYEPAWTAFCRHLKKWVPSPPPASRTIPKCIQNKKVHPWWLTSVILATQEAGIRRIVVQSQPRQIVLRGPISKKSFTKKGCWSGSRCRSWVQTPVLQKINK